MGTILDLTNGALAPFRSSRPRIESGDSTPSGTSESSAPKPAGRSRQELQDELDALRARELTLLRELVCVDHPDLADGVAELNALHEAAQASREQMLRGPGAEDERQRTTLLRRLQVLREQRAELDAKIDELATSVLELEEQQQRALSAAHAQSMHRLDEAITRLAPRFQDENIEIRALYPELDVLLTAPLHPFMTTDLVVEDAAEVASTPAFHVQTPPALPTLAR